VHTLIHILSTELFVEPKDAEIVGAIRLGKAM